MKLQYNLNDFILYKIVLYDLKNLFENSTVIINPSRIRISPFIFLAGSHERKPTIMVIVKARKNIGRVFSWYIVAKIIGTSMLVLKTINMRPRTLETKAKCIRALSQNKFARTSTSDEFLIAIVVISLMPSYPASALVGTWTRDAKFKTISTQ